MGRWEREGGGVDSARESVVGKQPGESVTV